MTSAGRPRGAVGMSVRRAACPVCQAPRRLEIPRFTTQYAPPHEALTYCYCDRCGLVYSGRLLPMSVADAVYREHYLEVTRDEFLQTSTFKVRVNRYRLAWLLERIRAHGGPVRGTVLEIGPKDGSFLKLMKDQGWSGTGIDPNEAYARWAREIYHVEIRAAYFQEGVVPAQSADLVAAFHLIEHIEEPLPFLATARKALRDNGWLYLETPNLETIQQRQLISSHTILYSPRTLRQTLEQAGFEVIVMSSDGPGMLTFDQILTLARAGAHMPQPLWRQADRYDQVRGWIMTALATDFPYPDGIWGTWNIVKAALPPSFREIVRPFRNRLRRGLRSMATGTLRQTERSADEISGEIPHEIRDSVERGELGERQLRLILSAPNDTARLRIWRRAVVQRLNAEQITALVDRERARGQGT